MKPPSASSQRGLPQSQFEALKAALISAFKALSKEFSEKAKQVIVLHSVEINLCSTMQRDEIKEILSEYGSKGWNYNDMIDKAALHGKGEMAAHLVTNRGMTAKKFKALPAADKKIVNSGTILVAKRNRVDSVPSPDMGEKDWRRVLSPKKAGLLTPDEQLHMSRAMKPAYHKLVGSEMDGKSVVLTFRLNSSVVKARVTRARLKALVKKYCP
jgi:hypothetical protein